MSREIKFRAWDRVEKKLWKPIVRPDGILMAPNQLGGYVDFSFQQTQDPLMQYTGLKDKNGKEIYEGDIIKGDEWENDVVVYKENKFILEPMGDDCIYWTRSEVIGNIHENPELLESNP